MEYLLTATEALAQIDSGSLTIEVYADSLLSRIRESDPGIEAWAHIDPEYILSQARALDQVPNEQRGPFHGVPVAVKDIIYTKGG
jgi:amidase